MAGGRRILRFAQNDGAVAQNDTQVGLWAKIVQRCATMVMMSIRLVAKLVVVIVLLLSVQLLMTTDCHGTTCHGAADGCGPACTNLCCIHALVDDDTPMGVDLVYQTFLGDMTFAIPHIWPNTVFQPPKSAA